MSKITLKCKKYKRKCIDKALSVYLEKAGYIFDSSSVEKVFNKLGLAQLGFTRIHSAQQLSEARQSLQPRFAECRARGHHQCAA